MQALSASHSARVARPGTVTSSRPGVSGRGDGVAEAGPAQQRQQQQQQPAAAAAVASRRGLLLGVGGAALLQALARPSPAAAASGLGRYIKKKTLDPLETYVPLVLQAQEQLLALKGTLVDNAAGAREALRTGAFSGLRDNVRALGEYAATSGASKDAAGLVNGFFRKLEEFDLLLYRAKRDEVAPDGEEAEAKLAAASAALAELIATVPEDVLARSRAVLEKVKGGGGAAAAAAEAVQSPEDLELLNELLTIWE